MHDDNVLLNGNLAIIKFVRTFSNLGLADAKYLVDEWADFVGQRGVWCVTDFADIEKLCRIVGKVNRGEWVILNGKLAWGQPEFVDSNDFENL